MDKKSRLLVMGKLYFKNKDYKLAENSFIEYLNSCPEDFQALKLLAQTYEYQANFSKAFDAYERCYLIEPDRKGVLLDICRLLLMNDSSLDHIDSNKWLKLAIQSFPSNPIVINLKQSLPVVDQAPARISHDNEIHERLDSIERQLERLISLDRGLDKLTAIEKSLNRLNEIEKKIDNLNLDRSLNKLIPMEKTLEQIETKIANLTVKGDDKKSVSSPPKIENKTIVENNIKQDDKPKVQSPPKFDILKKVEETPRFGGTSLFGNLNNVMGPPKTDNKSESISQPVQPLLFSFGQQPNSTDLFSNSLKKFDVPSTMPTTGNTFGLGQVTPLFSTLGNNKKEEENEKEKEKESDDEGRVEIEELPIENFCKMKPIEIKSGEEDEDILFKERCKLFRFRDKEYKERGLGDIKVLKHKETGKGRLIMRRELINKVCLNCWSCSSVNRIRDNQIRFGGVDASDGEPEMTIFLVKFKTPEMTDKFEEHLKSLIDE